MLIEKREEQKCRALPGGLLSQTAEGWKKLHKEICPVQDWKRMRKCRESSRQRERERKQRTGRMERKTESGEGERGSEKERERGSEIGLAELSTLQPFICGAAVQRSGGALEEGAA